MPNPNAGSSWKDHRNCQESAVDRINHAVSGWLFTGNRHRQAAWDQRGTDVVAGQRRQNLAPRPSKEMGGGRITPSGGRISAEDRAAVKRAKAVEKRLDKLGKQADRAEATAENLHAEAYRTTDPAGRRRLKAAAQRAEQEASNFREQIDIIMENLGKHQ